MRVYSVFEFWLLVAVLTSALVGGFVPNDGHYWAKGLSPRGKNPNSWSGLLALLITEQERVGRRDGNECWWREAICHITKTDLYCCGT